MRLLATILCLTVWLSQPLEALAVNLIRNPGFEAGLANWQSRANEPLCASVDEAAHWGKSCVKLKAIGGNCGIQTSPLYPGLDVQPDKTYALSAFIKNNGVRQGQFGLRLYCNDAEERCIVMKSFGEITAQTPVGGWQKHIFRFGSCTDFQLPKETDHVFVRASFYRKDGDCEGEVMLDDFELVREGTKAARRVEDAEKGSMAVWRFERATSGLSVESVATLLRKRGYAATVLSTNDLTDDEKLSAEIFDLLLVLDGSAYPIPAKMPLLRFLRGGGNLVVLGKPGALAELYPAADGWATEAELAIVPHSDVPVNAAAGKDVSAWKLNMDAKEPQPSLELIADGDTRALHIRSQLTAFQYATLDAVPPPDTSYCILRFSAKGDANTPYLAVEVNEKDKSRWKAVVPLSTSWQEYSLHTARLISYATEGRGEAGDHFHVERAAQVAFGYPAGLVGKGERSFSVRDVCWRKSRVAQDAPIRDGFVFQQKLFAAFGWLLKLPSRFFLGLSDALLGPSPATWARAGMSLRRPNGRRQHSVISLVGHERVRIVRADSALGQVDRTGLFGNSAVAFCTPQSASTAQRADTVAHLVDFAIQTPVLTSIEPNPTVKDGSVTMGLRLSVSNRSRRSQSAKLAIASPVPSAHTLTLPARSQLQHEVVAWPVAAFDWRSFTLKLALGTPADVIEDAVDVKAVLQSLCEFFLNAQKQRGDGKYSGITYPDGRVARTLLVGYDLFGKKEYLDSAMAWGDAVIAEQREDGGYRMGYGITAAGEECFVADGGEIGLGIARLYSYVPTAKKESYLPSLRKYHEFRESFRCEGDGLGIGYALVNYGGDPKKRFDKPQKVFDPEHNTYTIGCTLGFAAAYAAITGDPATHVSAARDARWLMKRHPKSVGGVFTEGIIWAHRFVNDPSLRKELEPYLKDAFAERLVTSQRNWWMDGGGRQVLALSALAYYHNSIRPDPAVLAHVIKVVYKLCARSSDDCMLLLLDNLPQVPNLREVRHQVTHNDWHYLAYGGVSLAEVLSPGSTMRPLR